MHRQTMRAGQIIDLGSARTIGDIITAEFHPVFKANIVIITQWTVTLCFVAIFLKHGKAFSQNHVVSQLDIVLALAMSMCFMHNLMHNVLIPTESNTWWALAQRCAMHLINSS